MQLPTFSCNPGDVGGVGGPGSVGACSNGVGYIGTLSTSHNRAALEKWDHTCMDSLDHMMPQLPFRDNVPPGNGVVCGIWAQTASFPVTLIAGIALPAYGPTGLLTCTTNPIMQADLVDFMTSPHVHAPCARDSLPSITRRRVNGDSTLDVAAAFHLGTVVCIRSVFCIVGLLDGDAMVRQLAMQANLLANTGANICLGNKKSLFVDMHNINPIPVGVATSSKDEVQITYCRWMVYLPMLREDGSTHMQPWYVHPHMVGCMLSPESIMAVLPYITSWYQEGFCDGSNPGILCFCNAKDVTVLKVTMQKQKGLYYGRTDVLSIDHNPIWVNCVDGALVIRVSTRLTSCDTQPPAAAPALIEDDKSLCGSLTSTTTTTPGVADDGGDAPVKNGLPSGGSNAPPCAPVAQEASHSQHTCRHKCKPVDPADILLSELWAACLGHCEEWQLEAHPDHANGLPPKFNFHPLRFVDHKIQA
jgi:hypothetical protein